MKKLLYGIIFGILILVSLYLGFNAKEKEQSELSKEVRTSALFESKLQKKVIMYGNIVPNKKIEIKPQFSGYVRKIYVKVGDEVKKGDPIVLITQSFEESLSSSYPIRANFNGEVVHIGFNIGEFINKESEEKFIRIDDNSKLYAAIEVPEIYINNITEGIPVTLNINGTGRSYWGKIRSFSRVSNNSLISKEGSAQYPALVEIVNKDSLLYSGMSVSAEIILKESKNSFSLEYDFIFVEKGYHFVYLEDGSKRKVILGKRSEDRVEIVDGLEIGEKVKRNKFDSIF